jgi:hypothetical protein
MKTSLVSSAGLSEVVSATTASSVTSSFFFFPLRVLGAVCPDEGLSVFFGGSSLVVVVVLAGTTGLVGSFFSSAGGLEFEGFFSGTFAVAGFLSVVAESTTGSGFLEGAVVGFLASSLGALGSDFFSGFVTAFVLSEGLSAGLSAGLVLIVLGALVTTEVRPPAFIRCYRDRAIGSSDMSSFEGINGLLPPVALGVLGGTTFFSSGLGTAIGG